MKRGTQRRLCSRHTGYRKCRRAKGWSSVCGLDGGRHDPGEPIFTHDDRDDSVHGGDDHRDLHCTSSEISSGTWPSLGGVVLQCTNQSAHPSRGITHRSRIRTAEEFRKPAKQPKKDANMDITRTSGKRVSAGQRDLATAGSNQAAVRKLWKTLAAVVLGLLLSVPGLARAQYRFTTIDVPGATRRQPTGIARTRS